MHYQISRNGQMYGPYTLEDLRRYVASGNILASDMAKSEEMTEWVPVSQVLAGAGAAPPPAGFTSPESQASGFTNPGYANPGYAAPGYAQGMAPNAATAASQYPDAPNLHWGLYTLFAVLTCTLFSKVFTIVQAAWLQRVQPNSKALLSYAVQYGILILSMIVRALTHTIVETTTRTSPFSYNFETYSHHPLSGLLSLLYLIMLFVSRFAMRSALEEHFNGPEPVGLRLSGVMTFFFGGIYFQYHLNRINAMKQAARFGAGRTF